VSGNHPNRGRARKPCVSPSPEEIRKAQERSGWTNAQCADACCVSEYTWEGWVSEPTSGKHREMPAGAWKLFRYEVGMLDPPTRS
jgi:hypothetical protein